MAVPVEAAQGAPGSAPWQVATVCGRVYAPEGLLLDVKWVAINATASGDNTVLKGTAGYKYRIIAMVFTCSGNVRVGFRSGATQLVQEMSFASNGGPGINGQPAGIVMETLPGDDFIFDLSGTFNVRGWLNYLVIPKGI